VGVSAGRPNKRTAVKVMAALGLFDDWIACTEEPQKKVPVYRRPVQLKYLCHSKLLWRLPNGRKRITFTGSVSGPPVSKETKRKKSERHEQEQTDGGLALVVTVPGGVLAAAAPGGPVQRGGPQRTR
jgi:hypothetical protein